MMNDEKSFKKFKNITLKVLFIVHHSSFITSLPPASPQPVTRYPQQVLAFFFTVNPGLLFFFSKSWYL